jgi:hypothetical protein
MKFSGCNAHYEGRQFDVLPEYLQGSEWPPVAVDIYRSSGNLPGTKSRRRLPILDEDDECCDSATKTHCCNPPFLIWRNLPLSPAPLMS